MDSDNLQFITNLDSWISIAAISIALLFLGIRKLSEDTIFNLWMLVGILILLVSIFVSFGLRL